jgi:hypothetical protein
VTLNKTYRGASKYDRNKQSKSRMECNIEVRKLEIEIQLLNPTSEKDQHPNKTENIGEGVLILF